MDTWGAIEVIEKMIQDTVASANKMCDADPGNFDRLNAGTGIGIRIRTLIDAKSAITMAAIKELENKAAKG